MQLALQAQRSGLSKVYKARENWGESDRQRDASIVLASFIFPFLGF